MMRDTRGRLTVPDVLFISASVFLIGALYPVFQDALQQQVASMNTGTVYLLQLLLPLLLLIMLTAIYRKAVGGAI